MPAGAMTGAVPFLSLVCLLRTVCGVTFWRRGADDVASSVDIVHFQWGPPSSEPIEMHLSFITDCSSH
jgi:hypothetical protein